ncbi:hypothetical protein [Nodularia chucula]|uniref:hypothetical protein n=1 Tax=Nodularia chucula TaxID=3093667 RepID=UPI0039C69E8B
MEQWQFLIQKQGDRSWHNLEWPNLEISAGWYRVLARSHLRNTDVEIRITHSSTLEIPAKVRIEKQLRRTNSEGLIPIIPFTHLQAGVWELQCSGNLISDLFSKSWEYGICLQVKPSEYTEMMAECHTAEKLESNLPRDADEKLTSEIAAEPEIRDLSTANPSKSTEIHQPVSPVSLKGETAEQILHNLIDVALPSSETFLKDNKEETLATKSPTALLCLTLDRENHLAHWGEIFVIHGRIDKPQEKNPEGELVYSGILYGLELVIELRSPLASEILTQVRQPLPNSLLPITISSAIDIPADCESQLILADITLYGALTELGEVLLLASQSFTITADVTQLLEAAKAAKVREQNLLDQSIAPAKAPESSINIDLGLFNLAKTLQTNHSPSTQISSKQLLPPQLNPLQLAADSRRVSQLNQLADSPVPQLPKLPETQLTDQLLLTEGVDTTDEEILSLIDQELKDQPNTVAPINLSQLLIKHHPMRMLNSSFPYLKRRQVLPVNTEEIASNTPETLALPAAEDSPELFSSDQQLENDSLTEISLTPDLELNSEAHLYSSPLLRKWIQSQGYPLPESVIEVLDQQNVPSEQMLLLSPSVEIDSSPDLEPETDMTADQRSLGANSTEMPNLEATVEIDEMPILEASDLEDILEPVSLPPPDLELPPVEDLTTPDWLTQEFVVEDTYTQSTGDVIESHSSVIEEQPTSDLSHTPLIEGSIAEPLPIPQLYVPDGELVAGTSVRVRVELPVVSPEIVVKVWMKDYQTRWLLDNPHLLRDFLPNPLGNLEVTTKLNIPFGCMEIMVEAIAYHLTTQQESHKVSVVRSVIPPDLPNFQLDELLGI